MRQQNQTKRDTTLAMHAHTVNASYKLLTASPQ